MTRVTHGIGLTAVAGALVALCGLGLLGCSKKTKRGAKAASHPGVATTVRTSGCASPGAGSASHLPTAKLDYASGRLTLHLEGHNVGVCGGSGPPEMRLERAGSKLELVTYRQDKGSCVSRCAVDIVAPITLAPGTYTLSVRRVGLHWLMNPVRPAALVVK